MNIRNDVRALSVAPVLAAAILGTPVEFAHAQPEGKNFSRALDCQMRGYHWDDRSEQCADKKCVFGGRTFEPGEHVSVPLTTGGISIWVCNGFTGVMYELRTANPTGPAAPGGNGTVAPTNTTSTGPVGPRPTTNAR